MVRKLLLALATLFALSAPALAQVSNPTCPTRPAGDSSNACASTAFVNSMAFGSGLPWCDPRAKGAVGDGLTDDYPAFAACLTVLANLSPVSGGGGMLYVPQGSYCIKSGTIDTTGITAITILGESTTVQLSSCGVDRSVVRFNSSLSLMSNILIAGKGYSGGPSGPGNFAGGFTAPALLVDTGCVSCRLLHMIVQGGTNSILIKAADVYTEDVVSSISYGDSLVKVQNTSTLISSFFTRNKFDTKMPGTPAAQGTVYNAWAANTAYAVNTVVSLSGYYIQAVSNTGDTHSGSSPPALDNIGVNIVDNHVTWQLIQSTNYCGIDLDSGAFEIILTTVDLSNVYSNAALCMTNNGGGTAPSFVRVADSTLSNVFGAADINLIAGSNFEVSGSEILGCEQPSCVGLEIGAAFNGQNRVINNWFGGHVQSILALSNDFVISDNSFGTNGGASIGVNIGGNVSNFVVANNSFSSSISTRAIFVNAGTSDYYNITHNTCVASINCVLDQGTGTHKIVNTSNGTISIGTLLTSTNTGLGTETNPQQSFVWSANATTGIAAPPGHTGPMFIGQDATNVIMGMLDFGAVPNWRFYAAGGTAGSFSALSNTASMGQMSWTPAIGANTWGSSATARIFAVATENQSSSTLGNKIVASTTKNGTSTRADVFSLDGQQHLQIGNATPSINSCSTGTVTASSTDQAGGATATGATTCAINFANTYASAPFCVANDVTRAAALQVSTTTGVLTVAGLTANDVFTWICFPKVGG